MLLSWHLQFLGSTCVFGKSVDPCVSHKIISDVNTLHTRKSLWDKGFLIGADKDSSLL
jgi:hypothetical protein